MFPYQFNADTFNRRAIRGGPGQCWEWDGAHVPGGYASLTATNELTGEKTQVGAHRVAYYLATGDNPAGKVIRHKCDNPGCVNPEHLQAGTTNDNVQDKIRRGRIRRGEQLSNAKLNPDKVREGRRRVAAGESYHSVAKSLGVNSGTLHNAVTGVTWKHVK